MKINRIFAITGKTLSETLRDPILLVVLLALPAFFMLINYIGYGQAPKARTYPVNTIGSAAQGTAILQLLAEETYPDGRPVFQFYSVQDKDSAEIDLVEKRSALTFRVETDSSGATRYISRGDALNPNFIKASARLESVLFPWLENQQGKPQYYRIIQQPAPLAGPKNDFEAYVPGMMVFAILLLIPQTAMLIGRERRWGTLQRMTLSKCSPAEYLTGLSLAQLVLAAFQVLLMFAAAIGLGFHNRGSLILAVLIGMLLAFGSIGWGLLLGVFMRTDTDALNTGSAVSMLQVFLSGAFFTMPAPILFQLAGYPIGLYDFIPATHAMTALQQVLTGGAGLETVAFRLAATTLLALFWFGLGIFIFRLKQH